MTSNSSELAPSGALTRHLIQYTATGPDGAETAGIATVTAEGDHIPWSQLAAIPGFLEGQVLREHDTDPNPYLLGPAAHEIPGHADWCQQHETEPGDGSALCWGQITNLGGASVQLHQSSGRPATVWLLIECDELGDYLSPAEARERAAELRRLADLIDAHAEVAEAGSAVER